MHMTVNPISDQLKQAKRVRTNLCQIVDVGEPCNISLILSNRVMLLAIAGVYIATGVPHENAILVTHVGLACHKLRPSRNGRRTLNFDGMQRSAVGQIIPRSRYHRQ